MKKDIEKVSEVRILDLKKGYQYWYIDDCFLKELKKELNRYLKETNKKMGVGNDRK